MSPSVVRRAVFKPVHNGRASALATIQERFSSLLLPRCPLGHGPGFKLSERRAAP